jgi:hypothetical protein
MVPPVVRYDEDGQYLVFPGKHCMTEGCGVALTSRNRYEKVLMCREHGMEHERNRVRPGPEGELPINRQAKKPLRKQTPEMQKLYAVFNPWARNPQPDHYLRLIEAMKHYELVVRLKKAIPAPVPLAGLDGIPVEEPTFTNPEHRSTRLEFLADCSSYGV